jgi:hypothetical protein
MEWGWELGTPTVQACQNGRLAKPSMTMEE